jgi:uncharacterized coiled-coil DUF342 family protein
VKLDELVRRTSLVFAALVLVSSNGCSKEQAEESVKQAEEAADTIAKDAEEVVEKGKEMADELGEKAIAFINPLREKFGQLEGLKDKPDELKEAVTDLIQSIEDKAEGIQLPEALSGALATVKEKLQELKQYLEGEVDQAKVEEHIQEIMDSAKSGLGMSD